MLGGRACRRPVRAAILISMLAVTTAWGAVPASAARRSHPADRLAFEVGPGLGDVATAGIGDGFSIVFPQDPTVSWFSHSFGMRKPSGRRHLGEDLFAPKSTPVYAVADGIVSHTGHSPRAGNYLVVEHADGWESWYIHLNDDTPGTDDGRADASETFGPGIEEGVFVRAGQVIGYVGDSGNAEGVHAHTHFELYHWGDLVDPQPYLRAAFERGRLRAEVLRFEGAPGAIV